MAKHILILGGGYGGLLSAMTARKYMSAEEAAITVVNRFQTHQIITELHRLAAGNVNEKAVALPLEKLLRGKDIDLKIDTVKEISPDAKQVTLASGAKLSYDALVIALGSETAFFGIPGLQEHSFILKSVDDANRLRAHVEAASKSTAEPRTKRTRPLWLAAADLQALSWSANSLTCFRDSAGSTRSTLKKFPCCA